VVGSGGGEERLVWECCREVEDEQCV
jgi:hypothetical protein